MQRTTRQLIALGILIGTPWISRAATIVFKCVKDGQTILSDRPCEAAPINQSSDPSLGSPSLAPSTSILVSSSGASSLSGRWAGQVQYHADESGQILQEAHAVVSLSVEFTPDGKVSGASSTNGCKLLGIWSEDAQHIVWLDITLSGCHYPSLNRRFTGSFLMSKPGSSGQLQLISTELPQVGQGARIYDIKGTLRR